MIKRHKACLDIVLRDVARAGGAVQVEVPVRSQLCTLCPVPVLCAASHLVNGAGKAARVQGSTQVCRVQMSNNDRGTYMLELIISPNGHSEWPSARALNFAGSCN